MIHTMLLRRHTGCGSVSNHQPRDCLLNRIFRRRSKNTSKLRVTGLCAGNSPGTVTRSFDVFFDLCLNKQLSKQSRRRWFETPSHFSWRHCNEKLGFLFCIAIYLRDNKLGWRVTACTTADSRFAPSQWETALRCYNVSHWLGASPESALYMYSTVPAFRCHPSIPTLLVSYTHYRFMFIPLVPWWLVLLHCRGLPYEQIGKLQVCFQRKRVLCESSMRTIPCPLMAWHFKSPGHQQSNLNGELTDWSFINSIPVVEAERMPVSNSHKTVYRKISQILKLVKLCGRI